MGGRRWPGARSCRFLAAFVLKEEGEAVKVVVNKL
jgi:hypothetical protein